MITPNEAQKIVEEIPGENRGVTLITDMEYIKEKKGKKGLDRVQKEMDKLGLDLKYKKIKNSEWYPAGWRIISLLVIKKTFNWGDKEIFNMGYSAPKNSFVVKALLRYFVSKRKTFEETPKYWNKHWTVGELETYKLDLENKKIVMRLKKFKARPVLCQFLRGYFRAIGELTLRGNTVSVQESKCMSRKDPYHEFIVTW